jgi:cellulose synthase/poly-beta-1,6-N-acetylglucosamine synthase-like glycosyltransferase
MSSRMAPRISVIVPFRNARRLLPALVDALRAQTLAQSLFEVLWVDDGSGDDGCAWLRGQLSPTWRVLASGERRGSYAARNSGLRAAGGDNVAFTDVDCRPCEDWLEQGLLALAAAPRAAGRIELELSDSPSIAELVDAGRFLRQRHYVQEGFAATANLFVRRAVFAQVGGFIEDLRSGGDQEFGWRCSRAGIPIMYADRAAVSHAARATLRGLLQKGERVGFGGGQVLRRGRMPVSTFARRAVERFTVARRQDAGDQSKLRLGVIRSCLVSAVHLLVLSANVAGVLRGVLTPVAGASAPHTSDANGVTHDPSKLLAGDRNSKPVAGRP